MIGLDLIDKKILCELDLNCRIPISQLARRLRIARNTASYRIKSLEKSGIITRYICSINLGLFGYSTYKIYLKIKNLGREEEKFLNYIIENKKVIHFLKTEGAFDYSITVAVKSIHELDDLMTELKTRFRNLIRDYNVSIVVYSRIFKLNKLLLNEKQQVIKFERYSEEERKAELNDKDKKIIQELSQKANLPLIELAEKTGFSVDVVKYRLKQLGKNSVNSYRVMLNLNKLGFYHYVIMLKMKQAPKQDEEKLVSWCSFKKNVLYVTKRIGLFDFEINAAITDINQLNSFISELKSELGEIIDSYDITINSQLLKLDYVPF